MRQRQEVQAVLRQGGLSTLAARLMVFAAALAFWLWRADTTVSRELELACRTATSAACVSGQAHYTANLLAAWLGQMFPWVLPFLPAFGLVFFFRWLKRHGND